jgi:hypothetical protein
VPRLLLSTPAMPAVWPTRLRRTAGPGWRRVRAEQPPDTSARWALAAGHARRGPGRSVAVDPASVWAWGERASWPWRALTAWLGDTVPSTEGHVDAWWRVGRQHEAPLPVAAKGLALSGAAWGWSACAPAGRLVAAFPW